MNIQSVVPFYISVSKDAIPSKYPVTADLLVGRVYCCSCLVCIVVAVLCVLLSSYAYLFYYVCIAFFTLDAGLLARSQYSEGPATGTPRHRFYLVSLCLK